MTFIYQLNMLPDWCNRGFIFATETLDECFRNFASCRKDQIMAVLCNVGGADKAIRIVAGVGLAALAFFFDVDTLWKILAGLAAAIALVTATAGFCPLNRLLGVNTCKATR